MKMSQSSEAPTLDDNELACQETQYNSALREILEDLQSMETIDNGEQYLTKMMKMLDENKPKKYQIIGDNIDMLIKTKQMSREKQNTDIHWFLIYAIIDEIEDLTLPEDTPKRKLADTQPTDCLPNAADKDKLNDIFTILWTRVIVKTIPAFRRFEKSVIWHIPHQYEDEMKKKSETVS